MNSNENLTNVPNTEWANIPDCSIPSECEERHYFVYCMYDKDHLPPRGSKCASFRVPVATVVLYRKGTEFWRGISICSPQDNFQKKLGVEYAMDYIRASQIIDSDVIAQYPVFMAHAINALSRIGVPYSCSSEEGRWYYKACKCIGELALTPHEQRMWADVLDPQSLSLKKYEEIRN